MPIGVQSFPLLTPDQANPFMHGLAQGLQLANAYRSAPYQRQLLKAEAASKQTYADFLPAQIISQMLSNPLYVSRADPQQLNALTQMLKGAMSKYSGNNVDVIQPSEGNDNPLPSAFGAPARSTEIQSSSISNDDVLAAPSSDQSIDQQSESKTAPSYTHDDISRAALAYASSPEAQASYKQNGQITIPNTSDLMDWYKNQQQNDQLKIKPMQESYFARANPLDVFPTNFGSSNQDVNKLMNVGMINQAQQKSQGSLMSGSGKGVGAGTTYVDANGIVRSSATNSMTDKLQSSINASQNIEPYINNLVENYPKTIGAKSYYNSAKEIVKNFITGGKTPSPTLRAMGQMNTDLGFIADSLMKDLTLNNNASILKSMTKAIEPVPGESGEDYKDRMHYILDTIHERDERSRQILGKGIELNPSVLQSTDKFKNLVEKSDNLVKSSDNQTFGRRKYFKGMSRDEMLARKKYLESGL